MNMIGLVRNEWKKVFLPVLLTTVLLAIAMSVLSCTIYQNYTLHYDLEAWEVGTELFSLLYPLFVVVPLCWNLYYERKNNFLLYVMPRVKIKKYLTAKWIAYALGTLCIIVIPYILSAVFALYVKPPVVPFVENPFSHIFENAFIKTPLLYAVALSLWRGIVSLFVMTFGFILALYCKNIFVILTGPFMYSILENFVLAILCLERLRLVVAFDPTTVNPEVVSIFSFFFGPIVLSIVIGLTAFLLSKKNAVVDGKEVQMEAYVINGNNYVKLRDMGKTVGFEVFWDSDAKCVQVKSGIPYTGEAPAKAEPDKPESHPGPAVPANDADVDAMKQDIVDRTNALRKENGIAALTADDKLMQAAQVRAEEMAASGVYSHIRPDGRKYMTVTDSQYIGENIHCLEDWALKEKSLPETVMWAWSASAGHLKNMTNSRYGSIGVGLAKGTDENGEDCWYCVQLFMDTGCSISWVDRPAAKQ